MTTVILAAAIAAVAILGERAARTRVSRSTAWLIVHPLTLLLAVLLLDFHVPSTPHAGAWTVAALGVVGAAAAYAVLRWAFRDTARRPLGTDYPAAREGLALVVVLPAVEQMLWGWALAPALGTVTVALLFAIKHPVSDGNWRRVPALSGFWLGISAVRTVDPFLAIASHMCLNAVAFAKTVVNRRDEF